MKIVNIWKFLKFMSMANAPTPGQRWMANALPLGHRKLANPPPYPRGGTLGDSLDTSIIKKIHSEKRHLLERKLKRLYFISSFTPNGLRIILLFWINTWLVRPQRWSRGKSDPRDHTDWSTDYMPYETCCVIVPDSVLIKYKHISLKSYSECL